MLFRSEAGTGCARNMAIRRLADGGRLVRSNAPTSSKAVSGTVYESPTIRSRTTGMATSARTGSQVRLAPRWGWIAVLLEDRVDLDPTQTDGAYHPSSNHRRRALSQRSAAAELRRRRRPMIRSEMHRQYNNWDDPSATSQRSARPCARFVKVTRIPPWAATLKK